ncbi:MAG: hypothetical protein HWN68_14500 [Desulfobacterales bacterium]|nr:hypothetical protein [Desulfobacterales bacterium]
MGSRFDVAFVLIAFLLSIALLSACISYRFVRAVQGNEVAPPDGAFQLGKTSLGEVLSALGAPDELAELEGKDLLLYERAVLEDSRLTLGIPLPDIIRPNVDLSAYGTLVRYDRLWLLFTPDRILRQMMLEKDSSRPYLKTLFKQN